MKSRALLSLEVQISAILIHRDFNRVVFGHIMLAAIHWLRTANIQTLYLVFLKSLYNLEYSFGLKLILSENRYHLDRLKWFIVIIYRGFME